MVILVNKFVTFKDMKYPAGIHIVQRPLYHSVLSHLKLIVVCGGLSRHFNNKNTPWFCSAQANYTEWAIPAGRRILVPPLADRGGVSLVAATGPRGR
jgi:hypothetical protein